MLLTLLLAVVLVQDDLPEGKGRETLENTCTECHGLDRVLSKLRTEKQWREIVVRMRAKGATMTDAELNTLVAYLTQNFGVVEKSAGRAGTRPKACARPTRARAVSARGD